jgi:hypothetical protein
MSTNHRKVTPQPNEEQAAGAGDAQNIPGAADQEAEANLEQSNAEEASLAEQAEETPAAEQGAQPKKRRKVDEESIAPKRSIWPFALAVSLIVCFLGIMFLGIMPYPVVLILGVLMLIGSAFGWAFERR